MNVLRSCWAVIKWFASCVGHFVLWSVWLLLAAILVLQIVIATSHELRVPTRLVRSFEDRLALAGLHASFDSASFDPSGHVLVENLRLFSDSFDEPLATCSSVFFKLDPLALLTGTFEANLIQGHGLTVFVPAMFSPSGRAEPVLEQVEFFLRRQDRQLAIEQLVGHAGPLAVSCHGALQLPASRAGSRRNSNVSVQTAVAQCIRVARELALWQAKLSAFEHPSLQVELTPDSNRLARAVVRFTAQGLELNQRTLGQPTFKTNLRGSNFRIQGSIPLVATPQSTVQTYFSLDTLEADEGASAVGISGKVAGILRPNPFAFSSWELFANAERVAAKKSSVSDVSLHAAPDGWPKLSSEVSVLVADQSWSAQANLDLVQGSGSIATEGRISPAIIQQVGERLGRDLNSLLSMQAPADIRVEAHLDAGWKPAAVRGTLSVDKVVAHDVALDGASAHFSYSGTDLQVNDIVLKQGENVAHGRYLMDTKTLDYRFLLDGRLRPVGINGWFHEWWPRFWRHFDFSAAPPEADVDVDGRWRDPHLTTVYIFVDAKAPVVRGVPFDRLRTTLFIRPDFYDGVEFLATRGAGKARGRFTRSVDLEQQGFRWMDFDVTGNLDIQETARLFGEQGTEIVDPFRFENAPDLKITGRLDGEASSTGEHQHVEIDVASKGAFQFFGFPLSDLSCHAKVQDHDIEVSGLHVRFADGSAQGTALVSGRGDDRTLKFDAAVQDASLGQAIRILEDFADKRRGQKPSNTSRFQQRVATGRVDLRASAKGLYQNPYSFVGSGSAELRGAELAQINLLGALSEALKGNSLLGFTSWRLDTARTNFSLERDKLVFPDLRITGPTARLDGHGSYSLEAKTVNFNAKFYPFEEGKTLLANAVGFVLAPVSAALELKLQGSLAQPKWYFAYGPTSLLRKIAGAEQTTPVESSAPAASAVPPALLRRR